MKNICCVFEFAEQMKSKRDGEYEVDKELRFGRTLNFLNTTTIFFAVIFYYEETFWQALHSSRTGKKVANFQAKGLRASLKSSQYTQSSVFQFPKSIPPSFVSNRRLMEDAVCQNCHIVISHCDLWLSQSLKIHTHIYTNQKKHIKSPVIHTFRTYFLTKVELQRQQFFRIYN